MISRCQQCLHAGRSLVKKDAGMLDAFGKGASDDIQAAKAELYAQVRSPASCPGHSHADSGFRDLG